MATTPNYGWVTPAPTDFVTDLPADFEVFADAVDADLAGLLGGTTGQVLTKASATDHDFAFADPPTGGGTTWTQRFRGDFAFRTINYNGSDLYVAAGGDGILATSPDGLTWTARTSGFGSSNIRKVVYGNGIWVAVGTSGLISSSTDGITWTARTANMSTNIINDVIYAGGYFVAVGNGGGSTNTGGLTYSTDGITWTRKNHTPTIGTSYYSVTYNGTNFVIGATHSTNNMMYASDPSSTWTELNVASSSAITSLHYDGTRTIYSAANRSWYYNTSATMASQTLIANVKTMSNDEDMVRKSFFYNGEIYETAIYNLIWNTTPVGSSNNYVNTGVLQISPSTQYNVSSPFVQANGQGIWAGAVGVIMGVGAGEIWTTF